MKAKIFALITLVLLVVFVVLIYGVGGQPMVAAMKQFTTVSGQIGLLVLIWVVVGFGPLYLGAVIRHAIAQLEDSFGRLEWWQEIILASLATVIGLVSWMALLPFMAEKFSLFRLSLTFPSYGNWAGYFESPPIWWGIYSGILTFLGYLTTTGIISEDRR